MGCKVFLPTITLTYGMKDRIIAKPIQKPNVNTVVKIVNSIGYVTNDAKDLEILSTII